MGPPGSGKSRLLRCLNGLIHRESGITTKGEILLEGKNLLRDIPEEELRQRIPLIPENSRPFPLSLYDNVAFGPRIQGLRDRIFLDALVENRLTQVGLWDLYRDRLKDSPEFLDPLDQKRLCLARALALSPRVLLWEEPFRQLPIGAVPVIENLLREIREKTAVIISSSDSQVARRLGEQTALFHQGRLVEKGLSDDIFFAPRNRATEDFISGRPIGLQRTEGPQKEE